MYAFIELIKDQSLIKKKLFKNSDFEEIIRYVLRTMGKADSSRDPQAKNWERERESKKDLLFLRNFWSFDQFSFSSFPSPK